MCNPFIHLGLFIVYGKPTQEGLIVRDLGDNNVSAFSRLYVMTLDASRGACLGIARLVGRVGAMWEAMSNMVAAEASGIAAVSILAVSRMAF